MNSHSILNGFFFEFHINDSVAPSPQVTGATMLSDVIYVT